MRVTRSPSAFPLLLGGPRSLLRRPRSKSRSSSRRLGRKRLTLALETELRERPTFRTKSFLPSSQENEAARQKAKRSLAGWQSGRSAGQGRRPTSASGADASCRPPSPAVFASVSSTNARRTRASGIHRRPKSFRSSVRNDRTRTHPRSGSLASSQCGKAPASYEQLLSRHCRCELQLRP